MASESRQAGDKETGVPQIKVTHEMVAALKVDRAVVDAISDLLAEMEVD